MSNFKCDKCDKMCIDTEIGYVTGCRHYPADDQAVLWFVRNYHKIKADYDNLAKEVREKEKEEFELRNFH